jgi:hypothetical protein
MGVHKFNIKDPPLRFGILPRSLLVLFSHTSLNFPIKVECVEGLNRSKVVFVDITNNLRNALFDLFRVFLLRIDSRYFRFLCLH